MYDIYVTLTVTSLDTVGVMYGVGIAYLSGHKRSLSAFDWVLVAYLGFRGAFVSYLTFIIVCRGLFLKYFL